MPGRDGTGPMRGGPMTGWGRGSCGSYATPGFGRGGGVRRMGRGGGASGWGWRHRFWASRRPGWLQSDRRDEPVQPLSIDAEQHELQYEAAALEAELKRIRSRLEDLQGQLQSRAGTTEVVRMSCHDCNSHKERG